MPFDPSKPYDVVGEVSPAFDPQKHFEVVDAGPAPKFDPSQPFEVDVPSAEFSSKVMAPVAPLEHSTLLEPWRFVPQSEVDKPAEPGVDQERVRQIEAYYDNLKDLAGDNPEMQAAVQSTRKLVLQGEGVGVVDFASKAKLPRMAAATSTVGKIGSGLVNAGVGLAEGVLQPEVLFAAFLPARAVSAFFAADMATHAPEQVKELAKAWKDGDTQRAVELGASTAVGAWLTKQLAEHAATPEGLQRIHQAETEFAKSIETAPLDGTKFETAAPVEMRQAAEKVAPPVQTFEPTNVGDTGREGPRMAAAEPADIAAEPPAASDNGMTTLAYTDAEGRSRTVDAAPEDLEAARAQIAKGGGTVEMVDGNWGPAAGDLAMAGDEQGRPAQGAAPAPPGLPLSLVATTDKVVTIPQIMGSLENVIQATGAQTPIRVGRFNQKALGIYKPFAEVARIRQADDISTATHEVAHALQKRIFGSSMALGLKNVPAPVKTELRNLGKILYKGTKPVGGYESEGFAEFVRHYVTTDDAARLAPHSVKWFEGELASLPKVKVALAKARAMVDIHRGMGSEARVKAQVVERPGFWARMDQGMRKAVTTKGMVEEFDALDQISKGFEERAGRKLAGGADPYLLASWKRGTAGPVVESMVNRGMQDLWGNPTGMSLRQALEPVRGQGEQFARYLLARRAIERWGKGKNPGVYLQDAKEVVRKTETPAFQLAAANYYEWNRGVLNYLKEANPAIAPTIDAILKVSKDYAPLARVIDSRDSTAASAVARSNPLYRQKGSGRQVRDIFETTIENTARLVALAHRNLVLDTVVKLSQTEGMGFLVEKVPRDRVREQMNFEKVRQQLEDMGVDTSLVKQDETLSFFSLAETPRGSDPIIPVKDADGMSWYYVHPAAYEALNGIEASRLTGLANVFLAMPARTFRLGTTGLRASFSLVTNPLRDFQFWMMNTKSSANPAKLWATYAIALRDVVRAGLGGKESPYVEAFHRLGVSMGQPLGLDMAHTKTAAKNLFHGRFMRVVRSPVEHLRELLSITEAAPRVAEMMLAAERVGWKPGMKMTPDQAVEIAVAGKRATVDFSAGGSIAKKVNQAVPFFNANIQGTRSFARTFRERPGRTILWGLATLTVPSLALWWENKDKQWYRQMPWRERYLYNNIDDGNGNVWQIPRTFEWGNVFQVAPEAILDSWYRRDPRGAGEALKYMFSTVNPVDWPVLGRIAAEQLQNRVQFFDRPIVPRNQVDLPPGDQRGPYTTKLAEWIGDAFPNAASPRRIDAAVRGFFGGAVPDLVEALGLGSAASGREKELADVPVLGRLTRRGGEYSAANQAIADFYEDYTGYGAKVQALQRAKAHSTPTSVKLTEMEYEYWKRLEVYHDQYLKPAQDILNKVPETEKRQSAYRKLGLQVEKVLKTKPKE